MAEQVAKMGAAFYEKVARFNIHEKAKETCLILAEEEMKHQETFRSLAEERSCRRDRKKYSVNIILKFEKLLAWIQEKLFTISPADVLTATSEKIVGMAIHIEEELIDVFEKLHGIFADANRETIEKILYEEKQHLMMLLNVKDVLGPKKKRQKLSGHGPVIPRGEKPRRLLSFRNCLSRYIICKVRDAVNPGLLREYKVRVPNESERVFYER